jgi:DNA-binding CsgD family transcriptional regulator
MPEPHDLALPLYLALRRMGTGKLPDVCAVLGVSVLDAEPAWRHLESMELIRPVGITGVVAPVDPDAALKNLLVAQQERLQSQAAELAVTHSRAREIATRFRSATMRDPVGVEVALVSERALRLERLRSLHLSSHTAMWSMHPGPLPVAEILDRSLELDAELVARGLTVRAVYGRAAALGPRARKYLKELGGIGVEVRLADRVPFDLLLFDATTAVMPSAPSRPSDPMLVLQGSDLMGTYVAMYEDVWSRSAPFDGLEGTSMPGTGLLSGRQEDVLRYLAAGLSDEQIGRRLGVSARTVRRIAAELMTEIGATSRFQAGVRAAELGLVG